MVPVHTSTWFILVTVGLVLFSQQGGEIYKQPVVRLGAMMGKYIKGGQISVIEFINSYFLYT